jgi:hypothetical protein
MGYVIAICGFVGGWLLVAGPVWQAAIELRDEEIDQEAIEAVKSSITPPPRIRAWWWLLPPVAYFLNARRQKQFRQEFNAALPPEALKQSVSFLNKANGWLIVALGGFLIAAKETWELVTDLHWPVWVFWVLIVTMPIIAIANTVRKVANTQRVLGADEPVRRRRQK